MSSSSVFLLSLAALRDKDQANRHTHFRTHLVGAGGSLVRAHVAAFLLFFLFLSLLFMFVPRLPPFGSKSDLGKAR